MKKYTKLIIISASVLLIGIFSFMLYGFYLLDIKDRHDDLQKVYSGYKTNDIIVNNKNGETGLIAFKNNKVVINTGQKAIDLDRWLIPDKQSDINTTIYRSKSDPKSFLGLNQKQRAERIRSEKLQPVAEIEIGY